MFQYPNEDDIDETGYSKTVAVEKAIRMFLDSQKADKKSDKE